MWSTFESVWKMSSPTHSYSEGAEADLAFVRAYFGPMRTMKDSPAVRHHVASSGFSL